MRQEDWDEVVRRAYREFRDARQTLAALQVSLTEIVATESITTDEGYLMYSLAGYRLRDTDYVSEQVAQYRAARDRKEALRKRLIELGEPDPE
jgi:hypothetical protein